ncbi:MAG: hypothetical protein JO316_20670 [Abitibacteriaceae bacterium]|nr:hypothetical protein [Abditibacteriaceae bacterium]MBV9867773.1 hypothetical protein [Abditibacteriaceae bacterium]
MQQFIIQSHRGAGVLAPENTVEAFHLAWDMGTVPEADLRTTQDGVIVAFHDKTFARVVKDVPPTLRDKGVEDIPFAQLAMLDVGAWQDERFVGRRVSPIAEILQLMPGHPERALYVDIKNVDLPQLAALVTQAGVEHQVILAAPGHDTLRAWKSLLPASQTLLWMGAEEAALVQRIAALRQTGFAAITQLQIHVHPKQQPDGSLIFAPSAAFLQALGDELRTYNILFQVLPWQVAEPEVYAALLDLGVQSFATDHPDITLPAVRDYFAVEHQA